jgi:predicted porin
VELWAHYGKGPLSMDATYQDTRNGGPVAWGLAPFKAVGYEEAADSKVGESGQSMAMVQAIYQLNPKIELSGAIRHNRWSGAYASVIDSTPPAQWNNMWNVDWGGTLNGVANPGYAATSTDWSAGALYRMDKWTFSTGIAHLGRANTDNPSERGQSNSVLVNTLRASYDFGKGLQLYATGGVLHYDKQGLSPLSLPSNASIENIDSRVTRDGNWFGVGAVYTF